MINEATYLKLFPQFSSLSYHLFCKAMDGDWPFPLLQKLNNLAKISPTWAAHFCLAIKDIGIDECVAQDNIYKFVTKHVVFKKNIKRYRQFFKKAIFYNYDLLFKEVSSFPDSEYKTNILIEAKDKYERYTRHLSILAEQKVLAEKKRKEHEERMRISNTVEQVIRQNKKAVIANNKMCPSSQVKPNYSARPTNANVWRNPKSASATINNNPSKQKNKASPVIIIKKKSNTVQYSTSP